MSPFADREHDVWWQIVMISMVPSRAGEAELALPEYYMLAV